MYGRDGCLARCVSETFMTLKRCLTFWMEYRFLVGELDTYFKLDRVCVIMSGSVVDFLVATLSVLRYLAASRHS